jgi:hypothetical protein
MSVNFTCYKQNAINEPFESIDIRQEQYNDDDDEAAKTIVSNAILETNNLSDNIDDANYKTNFRNYILLYIKKHIITTSDYLNFQIGNNLKKDLPDMFDVNNTPYNFSVLELYPVLNSEKLSIKKPVTLLEKESLIKAETLLTEGISYALSKKPLVIEDETECILEHNYVSSCNSLIKTYYKNNKNELSKLVLNYIYDNLEESKNTPYFKSQLLVLLKNNGTGIFNDLETIPEEINNNPLKSDNSTLDETIDLAAKQITEAYIKNKFSTEEQYTFNLRFTWTVILILILVIIWLVFFKKHDCPQY